MPEIPARFWLNLETDYQLTKVLINKRTKTAPATTANEVKW
jgi:plasmid maintenance system antidote protein VapI